MTKDQMEKKLAELDKRAAVFGRLIAHLLKRGQHDDDSGSVKVSRLNAGVRPPRSNHPDF